MCRVPRLNRFLLIQPTTLILLSTLFIIILSYCQSQPVVVHHSVYRLTHFEISYLRYRSMASGGDPEICARLCDAGRFESRSCRGYNYYHANTLCWFYVDTTIGEQGNTNFTAYVIHVEPDTFHTVKMDSRVFSLSFPSVKMNYTDASDHCKRAGAYLLQLDSIDKYYLAYGFVQQNISHKWVGASDLELDGQWVSDKDGSVIDFSVWQWSTNYPKSIHGCANVPMKNWYGGMFSEMCGEKLQFICERDF